MTTHSSILAWRVPRTEKPDGLVHGVAKSQTRLSDSLSLSHTHTHTHTQSGQYCGCYLGLLRGGDQSSDY